MGHRQQKTTSMGTTQLLNRSERKSSDPALPAFPAPQLPAGLETHRGCIGHIGHPQIICIIVVLKVLKLVIYRLTQLFNRLL